MLKNVVAIGFLSLVLTNCGVDNNSKVKASDVQPTDMNEIRDIPVSDLRASDHLFLESRGCVNHVIITLVKASNSTGRDIVQSINYNGKAGNLTAHIKLDSSAPAFTREENFKKLPPEIDMSCNPKLEYFVDKEDSSTKKINPMPDQGRPI